MVKICVISTKTSLSPLFSAVSELNQEIGPLVEKLSVYYTHLLDEKRQSVQELIEDLLNADIILIDIRAPTSWFVNILFEAISRSRAKVVLPLVVGSPKLLQLLRIGDLRGEVLTKRIPEYDFDTEYLDMSKVWKIFDLFEKLGRVLPVSTLKHLKNWILCIKYWTLHGKENLKNMLKLLLKEYFGLNLSYDEPKLEITPGLIWDPVDNKTYTLEDYVRLGRIDLSKPTVVVFTYSGMHFDQCKPVAQRLYELLREYGMNVVIVTGGASRDLSRNLEYLERNCVYKSKPVVDVIVNLQWFRLNGGPYGGPSEPTWDLLQRLDCILINGLIMYMREISKWESDPRGVAPIEVITGIALPEIDGAIEPIPLAGLSDDIRKEVIVIDDRIRRRARRVRAWVELRRKPASNVRIAIIVYNYPPGEDNIGSASYLDVFKSLENILKKLREQGYNVVVKSAEELKRLFLEKGILNSGKWTSPDTAVCPTLSVEEYLELVRKYVPEELFSKVCDVWGPPPGNINVTPDGRIVVPGVVLGNIFIGVQPSRGVHENPDKVYHSRDLPPHHQYVAFYLWLQHVFKADVVIHLGTHGTLEFLPGKEVGLSNKCYPDVLIGDLPHIYVYHVTNPSEMTIAKRRSYAYVITHCTPPFTISDLYEDYAELEELLHEYEEAKIQDPARCEVILKLIREKCEKLNIEFTSIEDLHAKLFEMKRTIIPRGLHVLGEIWSDEDFIEYATLVLRYDREVKSLHRILCEARGLDYDKLLENPAMKIGNKLAKDVLIEIEKEVKDIVREIVRGRIREVLKRFPTKLRRDVEEIIRYVQDLYTRVRQSDELGALIRAISGRYVRPRVAGDPIRTPEVFPTGSHGYAFDPRLIPSKAAYLRGAKIAEETLRLYYQKYGRYPETVAVVLWGFETMGTRGETIGEILQLLGVRLVRKHGPWSWDLEVIPLEELGRPRIDVVVTICGIFRDTFPNLITLIDRAVKLVAQLDEPPEMNYVRKHYLELRQRHGDMALIRIFGPRDGAYSTRLCEMIETSQWRDETELAETYIADMQYGYGENVHAVELGDLFRDLLIRVDIVSQIRYAHEYDIVDLDHYYEFLGGLKLAVEKTRGEPVETLFIDTTTEHARIRSVRDAIDLAVRTRLLNPKWIEGMLRHGYDGVREIAKRVEYVLGLAATTHAVDSWVFQKIAERYIFDEKVRQEMMRHNKYAVYEITRRLYEAYVRGYWRTSEEDIEKLRRIAEEIEREIEK